MRNHNIREDLLRTRIYSRFYRPSSNFSRFLGTIVSILLYGHSQLDNSRSRSRH